MPGIHIFIQLPVLIVLTAYFCRLNIKYAALASFLGLISISLTETVFNLIISKLTGITLKQVLTDPLLRLIFPIPEFVFLTLLVLILARKKIALFNIQELRDLEQAKSYEE
jgi:hypothetical protein